MRLVFQDDFAQCRDGAYPDGWICEQGCELPFSQGLVQGGMFHICPVSHTNKHLPLIPVLADCRLELEMAGNQFFSNAGLDLHFRYDRATRRGLLLRYAWGICGGQTHYAQKPAPEYVCKLLAYDGLRRTGKYRLLAESKTGGFLPDLSRSQTLALSVRDQRVVLEHDGVTVFAGALPDDPGLPRRGLAALGRSDNGGDMAIKKIRIYGDAAGKTAAIRQETRTEFPPDLHGIISPFYFHVAADRESGRVALRLQLTGGPSKTPVYPDIDRQRFNEKMINPYVRIEDAAGVELGKYLIFRGAVGLDAFHWNTACSVWEPADAACPLSREVFLEDLPDEAVFFIGYEHYMAEDSICNQGGPAEARLDAAGKVTWRGRALPPGAVQAEIVSPAGKAICRRIPKHIHDYEGALEFARRNHFFIEGESVRFHARVYSRDATLEPSMLRASFQLENVFGEPLGRPVKAAFRRVQPLPGFPGAMEYATDGMQFPGLGVGVYHIRARMAGAGGRPEVRRAFEVMPADPAAKPAPLVSGLPELYPNILSGIKNEHFHPWGGMVVDTAHYNSGGNNYFKVARLWNAPDLLHAYGRKFNCWLKPWCNVFEEKGIEPNRDLIAKSDGAHITLSRFRDGDLWGIQRYRDPRRRAMLIEFLRGGHGRRAPGGVLDADILQSRDPAAGLTEPEYDELIRHYWKDWMLYCCEKAAEEYRRRYAQIKAINPRCEPFVHGGTYPAYACGYKLGYFPLNSGYDLRGDIPRTITGPNSFEDYPLSSGYPIARGICHLAASKLEAPHLRLLPEFFGINGETRDGRVVLANPPYGRSDPPRGFFTKMFYEYCFAAVWFDSRNYRFWNDHGYHPKTWDRENYEEMLKAYAFISRVAPAKPLRTTAFCYSRAACLAHPEYHEADDDFHFPGVTMVNPAEEAPAYACEQARAAGQQNGFLMRLEDCAGLNPADVDLLVIPPLGGVAEETKTQIRNLHKQGVAILGFWDAGGLEDIFGVEAAPAVQASRIAPVGPARAALGDLSEPTNHELCVIRHRATTATALLADASGAPALVMNTTPHGRTAFFTLPPMFVQRSRTAMVYGQRSNSPLLNRSAAWIQELLGKKAVATSAGTLIAFQDQAQAVHIIVAEDRCPSPGQPIRPLVRINLPGLTARRISADKDFEIVRIRKQYALLRLALDAYASARIRIAPA